MKIIVIYARIRVTEEATHEMGVSCDLLLLWLLAERH